MKEPVIVVRGSIARRVLVEAEKQGVSVEEYILDLVTQDLDPEDKAREYIRAALELLQEAREELRKGDTRQAAEKLWNAAALAVKAYAWWRDGKRLSSHGELWEYKRRLEAELGEWVHDSWANATGMHLCFHEGWCTGRDVSLAIKRIERLVQEAHNKVGS